MRIRITLERDAWTGWNGRHIAAQTIVREFDDAAEADGWFVSDSYFAEPYTRRAVWERLEDR